MEWSQLQYFQTVARLQHFTRASEKLNISQPALSRAIARLEEELGVPLFERQGRTISLNRYGQIFLKRVNNAMYEICEGQQEIQHLVDPFNGSVLLGFLHSQGSNLVPDLLGLFNKNSPNIKFQLYQNTSNRLLDKLETSGIDLCFCSQPVARAGIQWIQLLTEELFVIVPQEHKLSIRSHIKLKELAEEQFITFRKELTYGEITDRLFREAGFSPNITFEGEEIGTIARLVAAKLGIALIPYLKGLDMTGIVQLHVSEPICQRVIGMAWVEGGYLSPAAKSFKQFVLDHF